MGFLSPRHWRVSGASRLPRASPEDGAGVVFDAAADGRAFHGTFKVPRRTAGEIAAIEGEPQCGGGRLVVQRQRLLRRQRAGRNTIHDPRATIHGFIHRFAPCV